MININLIFKIMPLLYYSLVTYDRWYLWIDIMYIDIQKVINLDSKIDKQISTNDPVRDSKEEDVGGKGEHEDSIIGRQIDRKIDRQIDRQIDRYIDRQVDVVVVNPIFF